MKEQLAFLDRQRLSEPSVNDQIGFDFQGLKASFKEDSSHPASKMVAHFRRVWIYDVALALYAGVKTGRFQEAAELADRLTKLGTRERERGFRGLWHFSYNTREDNFIDPRGPAGANAWCLNALYAYALAVGDGQVLGWTNEALREGIFPLQVMDPQDPRRGLVRAGLHNADEIARGEANMGYQVYEGDLNHRYEHVILEHCADLAGTLRLAYRANRRAGASGRDFLEELVHRHDLLMQGIRKRFWHGDHFVSALDDRGGFFVGTDGTPSIAVDNNTWAAHIWLPYDPALARQAVRFVEDRFRTQAPPARVEDAVKSLRGVLKGVFYFPATFMDPFVQVPPEYRKRMERLLQPEAAFGLVLFLRAMSEVTSLNGERAQMKERALELYHHTVELQKLYGPSGAPYASANVPSVFSTLHSVTTAATGVITTAILQGAPADDFIGVYPPPEFTVAGRAPLHFAND